MNKWAIVLLFLFLQNITYSQEYVSKIIPIDFNPNASNLLYADGRYIIRSINSIENGNGTSLLILDENLNLDTIINYIGIYMTRDAPVKIEDYYYGYGYPVGSNTMQLLIKMDNDLNEIERTTYTNNFHNGGPTSMTRLDDEIVTANWNFPDCPLPCAELNFNFYDTEGNELNSFVKNEDGRYLFTFELDTLTDGYLLTGGNLAIDFGNTAFIYKLDTNGDFIWKYISGEQQSRGNVPVWTEELSDGNIVYTDKINRIQDPDFIINGWDRKPNKIGWLSANGDSLFQYLDTIISTGATEYNGLKSDGKDHFYVYGYQHRIGSSDSLKGSYGTLLKFSNEGDLLWYKKYQHEGFGDITEPHNITDIQILENGDVVTLGTISIPGSVKLWMMHLNKDGCFGNSPCGDEVIYTSVSETNYGNDEIFVYPNPSNGLVHIQNGSDYVLETYTIYDINGKRVCPLRKLEGDVIDISHLKKGYYVISLMARSGEIVNKNVVYH